MTVRFAPRLSAGPARPVSIRRVEPAAPLARDEVRVRVVASDNERARISRASDYPTSSAPVAPDEISALVAAIVARVEGGGR